MTFRHLTAAATTLVLAGTAFAVAPAQASADAPPGTRSLAKVLAADGSGFDKNARDFDILDNAVRAVLAAKPHSPVGVLAEGKTRVTAFAPTDGAFRRLAEDVTGKRYVHERRVFGKLAASFSVDQIESVLLYHVVPGTTVTYKKALAADGATLPTALKGATLKVRVVDGRVVLVDKDKNDANARVIYQLRDINKGNRQIAHGVNQVLRPIDL